MENKEQMRAYKEVLIILDELDLKKEIPADIVKMMENEQDPDWDFKFYPDLPLEEQKILKSSSKLLLILYLSYICKNETEKKEIIEILEETEKIKQENYADLFNKKEKVENSKEIKVLESKKENIWDKIKNLLRRFFNIKKWGENYGN